MTKESSDGSTASYYELPEGATELQDLISYRDMNYAIGFIFTRCYDYCTTHRGCISVVRDIVEAAEHEIARLQQV